MEIKDNRELMKRAREEKEKDAEVCRACGSKDIHTYRYGTATPDCVKFLNSIIRGLLIENEQLKSETNESGS